LIMVRFFDIFFSLLGLVVLFPFVLLISLAIVLDSRGGIFFRQLRVGKGGRDFRLMKFRTMKKDADKAGSLTVGKDDSRITRVGRFLRKRKLDEWPQLLNVLKGDMSLVGPRPEVRKYVGLYTPEQRQVLSVRPGITDYASLEYFHENEILAGSTDPERLYIEKIMPEKLELNRKFLENPGLRQYFSIIGKTLAKLFR
jgi:lipopolysaccharide/colanic/teichoic acid biosynthesis glycosyltransferase